MPEVSGVAGVPAYRIEPRGPKTADAVIGVPVLNEGERIRSQLREMGGLDLAALGADVAIADGGSTDGALDDEALASGKVRALLVKRGPGALGAQLRMLFHWALGEGYDYVVTIDGNGKDGLGGIARVLAALREGCDFVQGSRYVEGGVAINTPPARHWAVRLIHAPLISLGARRRYTDTTNGLRGWRAAALADPRVAPLRDVFDTYNLHYYLSVRLPRLGYRVREVPATRAYPPHGEIPTKIRGVGAQARILADVTRAAAGGYSPP
jgi:dolichol-phosphate mannosyltransferase